MSNDYTFIGDLNGGGANMQGPPGMNMPIQGGPNQFDMIRKYLADTADDSDSDSESDDEDDDDGDGYDLQHYYGIPILIMLAIILYYIFKIRQELTGIYEEA